MYEKSKAYSDIPDLIGGGGGSSTSSTPSKKTSSAELFGEESDEDIDMKADINVNALTYFDKQFTVTFLDWLWNTIWNLNIFCCYCFVHVLNLELPKTVLFRA